MKKILNKYTKLPVQIRISFWFLICSFFQRAISVITVPIFTRLLTSSEYGEYNVFNSWLGILSIIVSLNLYTAVYEQGLIKFSDDKRELTSSFQGLVLTLTGCWFIVYILFREFWNSLFSLTTIQMMAMFVIMWTSSVFNFWALEQRVEFKYKALLLITILVAILQPGIGIIFVVFAKDKVTARIIGIALVQIVFYTHFFFVHLYKGKRFFSKRFWKYGVLFNLPLIPHFLSQVLLNNSDRIMINSIVGSAEAGIYGLAYSVAMIMILFNTSFMQALSPWIYQKIKEEKIESITPVAYSALILIAVVNLLLILLAPEAISLFAPAEYHEAIWVIPPIAMSVYLMFAYDLFSKFSFYYEKNLFVMCASISGALLNIGLNYIFLHLFGYIAAGYTTLICYILFAVLHYCCMKSVCNQYLDGKTPYELSKLLTISGCFMVLGFLFMCIYEWYLIRYGCLLIIVVVCIFKRKKIIALMRLLFKNNN